MRTYFPRACLNCGKEYLPTVSNQKYCPECRHIMKCRVAAIWQKAHPDYRRERYPLRADYDRAYTIKWTAAHPEYEKEWNAKNPEKLSAKSCRHRAKRRALGFVPLNSWFDGSEAHHVNLNDVVYIPKEIHWGIRHNIWTGKNMAEINAAAYQWLGRGAQCQP